MSFESTYGDFKGYTTPTLKPKHARRLDREFWIPAACEPGMSVLEIGCGTGLFLAYLRAKGIDDFLGIDLDPRLADVVPGNVRERFRAVDVWEFLDEAPNAAAFDRIALFDVIEHFTVADATRLLERLRPLMRPGGRLVLKTPNGGSPWGLQYRYGDLTHKAAYTPGSMRQLAIAAGWRCTAAYPHYLGSPSRVLFDRALHGLLDRVLATPPEIWTANFFAILEPLRGLTGADRPWETARKASDGTPGTCQGSLSDRSDPGCRGVRIAFPGRSRSRRSARRPDRRGAGLPGGPSGAAHGGRCRLSAVSVRRDGERQAGVQWAWRPISSRFSVRDSARGSSRCWGLRSTKPWNGASGARSTSTR